MGGGKNCATLDPVFFCLCDFSGHLIGMITVHVDDMLLTTNISHRAESHISRLLSKHDIKDVKRDEDDGGEFGVCWMIRNLGVCLCDDQTVFVKARCEPASLPWARARQDDESLATSQLQGKQSAPLVTDHKRAVPTLSTLEEPAGNWFEV